MAKATKKAKKPAKPDNSGSRKENATQTEMVKRRDFVERVAARSGMRANQVRPVMDAVLNELAEALLNGESLNVDPLGRIQVNRRKDGGNADVLICRLRRKKVIPLEELALAEPAE